MTTSPPGWSNHVQQAASFLCPFSRFPLPMDRRPLCALLHHEEAFTLCSYETRSGGMSSDLILPPPTYCNITTVALRHTVDRCPQHSARPQHAIPLRRLRFHENFPSLQLAESPQVPGNMSFSASSFPVPERSYSERHNACHGKFSTAFMIVLSSSS